MKKKDNLGLLKIDTSLYSTRISSKFKNRKHYEPINPKLVMSFIPGTVLNILVREGQEVKIGNELMILDAMKMKNQLKCNIDGKIKRIIVKNGEKVSKGTLLLEME